MKYRCATRYSSNSGTVAVTAAAIWYGQLAEYNPWRFARPTSTTCISVERAMTSGQRKLFHWSLVIARSTEMRSEEHTSELQSRLHLVCRLLLEKKQKD